MPLALAALWLVTMASVGPTGAQSKKRSRNPNVGFIHFKAHRVRHRALVFKPRGIPSDELRRAFLRYGKRRRPVKVNYVGRALDGGLTVRVSRRIRKHHRRIRIKRPRRARLVIAYRVPNFFVSAGGSDANPGTKASPFRTLNRAYGVAAPGDWVEVEGGTYGEEPGIGYQAKGSTADVTFVANGPAHLSRSGPTDPFVIAGDHIAFLGRFEFDRIYLRDDAHGGADGISFRRTQIHGVLLCGDSDYDTFVNNRFGPNNLWGNAGPTNGSGDDDFDAYDCNGGYQPTHANTNLQIIGNRFDGAYRTWEGSHSDCIQFTLGDHVLIARNTFRNCFNETVMIQGDQGHLSHFVIENNYLGRPLSSTDPFPIQITGPEPCIGCSIRFNSLPVGAQLSHLIAGSPSNPNAGSTVYGNITENRASDCSLSQANGWTWDSNVFISGAGTCGSRASTTSNPYRDSAGLDLRLVPGSAPINAFSGPEAVPATDIDGTRRPIGGRPDAGAYETR